MMIEQALGAWPRHKIALCGVRIICTGPDFARPTGATVFFCKSREWCFAQRRLGKD